MTVKLTTEAIFSLYPFFQEAPATLQDGIMADAQRVSVHKGRSLYRKADLCSQVVLVGQGSIRVFALADTGREISLYRVDRGGSCPVNIMCVLLGSATPANAVADSALEAVALPAESFRSWVTTDEGVRRFAFEAMGNRLVDVITLVEELVFQHVDARLADFLLKRFNATTDVPPVLTMTHEDIALELGSVREVISRILQDFSMRGVVKLGRGRITLLNESRLQELTSH